MYTLTSSGTDSHGAHVVIITCQACGYFEEHFRDRDLDKVGTLCDRCRRQGRKAMTQQQGLLPANPALGCQYLPAATEGLGPAEVQRLRSSLTPALPTRLPRILGRVGEDAAVVYNTGRAPTFSSTQRLPCQPVTPTRPILKQPKSF